MLGTRAPEVNGMRPASSSANMPSPTQTRGFAFEEEAERMLVLAGYVIIARNWRGGGGEIDRVGWDGEILCFVEVRARNRADHGSPSETVDRRKQRKVVRAATAFLCQFSAGPWPMARFDVVSIVVEDRTTELIQNAFDAGW